ncbi:MAG: hypothetical protein QXT45_04660 [Candidatus Bilamarchaeaceae archaeon]
MSEEFVRTKYPTTSSDIRNELEKFVHSKFKGTPSKKLKVSSTMKVVDLVKRFAQRFREKYGVQYLISGKDHALAKKLATCLSVRMIEFMIDFFFREFLPKNTWLKQPDFGVFYWLRNRLVLAIVDKMMEGVYPTYLLPHDLMYEWSRRQVKLFWATLAEGNYPEHLDLPASSEFLLNCVWVPLPRHLGWRALDVIYSGKPPTWSPPPMRTPEEITAVLSRSVAKPFDPQGFERVVSVIEWYLTNTPERITFGDLRDVFSESEIIHLKDRGYWLDHFDLRAE